MRLFDLIEAAGSTPAAVATLLGVELLLLQRFDEGRQPIPKLFAARVAALLQVELQQVKAACPLNTDLENPLTLLRAIPAGQGEVFKPARIYPTQPLERKRQADIGPLWLGDNSEITGDVQVDPAGEQYAFEGGEWRRKRTFLFVRDFLETYPDTARVQFWAVNQASDVYARASETEVWAAIQIIDNIGTPTQYVVQLNDKGEVRGAIGAESPFSFPRILAKDPLSASMWGVSAFNLRRFDIPTATEQFAVEILLQPDETDANATEMMFVDTYLYVLYGHARADFNDGVGIVQVFPAPGFESVVGATPNPVKDPPPQNARFTYHRRTDAFFITAQAPNKLYTAPRSTLALSDLPILETAEQLAFWGGPIDIAPLDVVCAGSSLWVTAGEGMDGGFGFRYRLLELPLGGGNALRSFEVPMPNGIVGPIVHMKLRDNALYIVGADIANKSWIVVWDLTEARPTSYVPFAADFINPTTFDTSMPQFGFVDTPILPPPPNVPPNLILLDRFNPLQPGPIYGPLLQLYLNTDPVTFLRYALTSPTPPPDGFTIIFGGIETGIASDVLARSGPDQLKGLLGLSVPPFISVPILLTMNSNCTVGSGFAIGGEFPFAIILKVNPVDNTVWLFDLNGHCGHYDPVTDTLLGTVDVALPESATVRIAEAVWGEGVAAGFLFVLTGQSSDGGTYPVAIAVFDPTTGGEAQVEVTESPDTSNPGDRPRLAQFVTDDVETFGFLNVPGNVAVSGDYRFFDGAMAITHRQITETPAEMAAYPDLNLFLTDVVFTSSSDTNAWFIAHETSTLLPEEGRTRLIKAPAAGGTAIASYAIPTGVAHMKVKGARLYLLNEEGQGSVFVFDTVTGVVTDVLSGFFAMQQFGFV